MDKIKTMLAGGALVLATILVSLAGGLLPTQKVQLEIPEIKLGAVPSTVITSQDFSVGGINTRFERHNFINASSTLVSFKTPNATSTLESLSFSLNEATSTALTFYVATSTAQFTATSSANVVLSASSLSGATVESTYVKTLAKAIIRPNTYIIMWVEGLSSAKAGYRKEKGVLTATLQEIR